MIELIGYHGTTEENATKILDDGQFKESTSNREWLGRGVYFFTDIENARYWAIDRAKRVKTKYAVLRVHIECEEDSYLDLDLRANFAKVEAFVKNILKQSDRKIEFHNLDEKKCFACDLYKRINYIDVVSFTFSKKTSAETKALMGFQQLPEKQLCVSNNRCIHDIKIISKE